MNAQYFLLRVRTAGLLGSANLEQDFDHSDACLFCGAGARPVPPLRADLARMGKKPLDLTAHDGHVVLTRALADELQAAGFTGFHIQPVIGRSPRIHADAFRWLQITFVWPRLAPSSHLAVEDLCPVCERAGHFDVYPSGTQLVYSMVGGTPPDFGLTWECFGVWRVRAAAGRRPVGGAQYILVSDRARDALDRLRRRYITFDPVSVSL